jgi:hypothetical protein
MTGQGQTAAANEKRFLFVIRSLSHLSYHSSTIQYLAGRGHTVKVISPNSLDGPAEDCCSVRELMAACPERVSIQSVPGRKWNRTTAIIVGCRELRSYGNYLRRGDQSEFYGKRWEGYLLPWSRRLIPQWCRRQLLKAGWVHRLLAAIENLSPVDTSALERVRNIAPDVVVASPTNMSHSEEIEYAKAAKYIGIPTAIPVLSWDNLTTKGFLAVKPDLLLAWNRSHQMDAIRIHGIPKASIRISGSPFFDKWFAFDSSRLNRGSFLTDIGIDPKSRYVLYLGSSVSVAADEILQLRALREALDKTGLNEFWIVARPHPSNAEAFHNGPIPPNTLVWPEETHLPDSEATANDFFQSVYFSEAAIGLNTTAMVDAIVIGKPCITWLRSSSSATQWRAVHFQDLLRSRATYLANSAAECAILIQDLAIKKNDPLVGARLKFVETFLRPNGIIVPAAEHAGRYLEILAGVPQAQPLPLPPPVALSSEAWKKEPYGVHSEQN